MSTELCFKGVQFPPPAYLGIQILCDPVACSIESFIFCSIFTSGGTFHKKQSNSTAGVNKLKGDAHYQLQAFLVFEVFSISLSLHQHQWSHSWEAIKVTQLEMINERSVTTTALNIGVFGLFFFFLFVRTCLFICASSLLAVTFHHSKSRLEYNGGNVSHHSFSLKARYMMFLVSRTVDNWNFYKQKI